LTALGWLGIGLVSSVVIYYDTGDETMVSADRRTTIMPIIMAGGFKEAESNVESVLPGEWNWYLLGFLKWLPQLQVEDSGETKQNPAN
jgi:hypothetical protein